METLGETGANRDPALGEVVVGEADLKRRIGELGRQITEDYHGRFPLLVGVLKGAFVFMSDLARAINLPVEFDYTNYTSMGGVQVPGHISQKQAGMETFNATITAATATDTVGMRRAARSGVRRAMRRAVRRATP